MGYVSRHDHALLDFRLYLPREWTRDEQRRQECHVPPDVRYQTRQAQCLEMLAEWRDQVPHGWVTGDDELGRHTRFRQELRERGERYVLGVPCTRRVKKLMRLHARSISGGLRAVHDTEWGLDSRGLGWIKERGGRCLSLDDFAHDDHGFHTP
jgi:DDE superfamily endonuclease